MSILESPPQGQSSVNVFDERICQDRVTIDKIKCLSRCGSTMAQLPVCSCNGRERLSTLVQVPYTGQSLASNGPVPVGTH